MKKLFSMILAAALLLTCATPVWAKETGEDQLSIAQQEKDWAELEAQLHNSRGARGASGTYERRAGIILVTKNNESMSNIKFVGHAAIMYNTNQIIHVTGSGVIFGANNWYNKNSCYVVGLYSTSVAQDQQAANWAYTKKKQNDNKKIPYNYNFFNVDQEKSLYCSQMVYLAYRRACGVNLNTSYCGSAIPPIELVNNKLGSILYQKG